MEAALTDLHEHDPMASSLPMDIIATEILPRVPAKSLLRFKCVCKFFKTLISSSEFINLHLRHSQSLSSESNRLLILLQEHRLSIFDMDSVGSNANTNALQLPIPLRNEGVNPVGSCNGLLCFQIRFPRNDFMLILLNPCTGIYRSIPSPRNHASFSFKNLGFGYDSEANDYKIVEIRDEINRHCFDVKRDVMVYSLKANSWRLIEKEPSPQNYIAPDESSIGALIDNHLFHWMYWFESEPKYRIRCFNLRTERWENDVPVPNYQTADSLKSNLGVLHGLLCLSVQYFHEGCVYLTFDVWIMKEYGVMKSWMKLFSHYDELTPDQTWMPNQIPTVLPLAYRRGSRSEVLICQRGKLVWYNVRDKTAKKAEIHRVRLPVDAYVCSGSLVGFDGGRSMLDLKQGSNKYREQRKLF